MFDGSGCFQLAGDRESGELFSPLGRSNEFVESVTGPGEQLIGVGGIPVDADLFSLGLIHARSGKLHRHLEAIGGNARPGNIHMPGIRDGYGADKSRAFESGPSLRTGLIVGGQSARQRAGSAVEVDGDLAFGVQTGEVVVIVLGDAEPVADEDKPGFEERDGVCSSADDGVFAEFQDLVLAIAFEREAGAGFIEFFGDEFNGLNVALLAGGFETIALKLLGNVFRCFAVSFAAGVPAFEFVRREELDVRPPAGAAGRVCGDQGDCGDPCENSPRQSF